MSVKSKLRLIYPIILALFILSNPAYSASIPPEIVMTPGMTIAVNAGVRSMSITAGKNFERTYTWNKCTRTVTLEPRSQRWYGSLGLFHAPFGFSWDACDNVRRAFIDEGQQHFNTLKDASIYLSHLGAVGWTFESTDPRVPSSTTYTDKRLPIDQQPIYTNDGLVIQWWKEGRTGLTINIQVWQILINGKKPTSLPGAQDSAFTITNNPTK